MSGNTSRFIIDPSPCLRIFLFFHLSVELYFFLFLNNTSFVYDENRILNHVAKNVKLMEEAEWFLSSPKKHKTRADEYGFCFAVSSRSSSLRHFQLPRFSLAGKYAAAGDTKNSEGVIVTNHRSLGGGLLRIVFRRA